MLYDDETKRTIKRKYRPNELLKIGEVTERLGKEKQMAEKEHKKINKTRKATGTSYEDAIKAIENKEAPKEKRKTKKVVKLDL